MAAKSSFGDAAAAVIDVDHMVKVQLEEALEADTAVAAAHSTSADFAASSKSAVHTFCAGHVQRAKLQKQGSSTGECDMRSEDIEDATFEQLP